MNTATTKLATLLSATVLAATVFTGCTGKPSAASSDGSSPSQQSGSKEISPRASIGTGTAPVPIQLALSPDGKLLIGGASDNSQNVQFWDLEKQQLVRTIDTHTGSLMPVAMSPDGKSVAYVAGGEVVLVEADSGKEIRRLKRKEGGLGLLQTGLHISRAGDLLAVGTDKEIVGFDPRSGEQRFVLGNGSTVSAISDFFDGGKKIAAGGDKDTVTVWDIPSGKPTLTITGDRKDDSPNAVAVSEDGKFVVSACTLSGVRIWDGAKGTKLREVEPGLASYGTIVFQPGSRSFAYGGKMDHNIRLVNAESGETIRVLKGHTDHPQGLAFTADGAVLVSSGDDKSIKVWNLK